MAEQIPTDDVHAALTKMAAFHAMVADASYAELDKVSAKNPDNKFMRDYYRDRMQEHRHYEAVLKQLIKTV